MLFKSTLLGKSLAVVCVVCDVVTDWPYYMKLNIFFLNIHPAKYRHEHVSELLD